MKLINLTREKINKYYDSIKKNTTNMTKSDFQDAVVFISSKWSNYQNAKQTRELEYLKNTDLQSDKIYLEHLLNTMFVKVFSMIGDGDMAIKSAKLYDRYESKIEVMQFDIDKMRYQNSLFKHATNFLIKESGKPVLKKYDCKSKWQNFDVKQNYDKPDLVEYMIFSMCADQVSKSAELKTSLRHDSSQMSK